MTIHVSGAGLAHAPSDRAVATLVARAQDADVQVALAGAARVARIVVEVAEAHAVSPEQRTTTTTSLNPQMDQETYQRVVGYEAIQVLRIVVADLSRVGSFLAEAVGRAEGAVSIQSVRLEVADPAALLVGAREAAFADARARAEQLASLAGRELGRVLEVREGDDAPAAYAQPRMMAKASAPDFEAGSAGVGVRVHVTFDLV